MSKPVRIRDFVASQVEALAAAERRSFANTVETLLLDALEAGRSTVRTRAAVAAAADVERPLAPADVAATIPGVQVLRPHMRRDRPALQCDGRVAKDEVCPVCGAVG